MSIRDDDRNLCDSVASGMGASGFNIDDGVTFHRDANIWD
jgi:hypothetical protein